MGGRCESRLAGGRISMALFGHDIVWCMVTQARRIGRQRGGHIFGRGQHLVIHPYRFGGIHRHLA